MITHPSTEQSAFFDALASTNRSLMLDAAAGAGKTSTIVHGTSLLPFNHAIKFLAFNKNIQQELEARLPSHVQSRTFHSDGYQIWRRFAGRGVRLDSNKCAGILKDMLSHREFELYFSFVLRLVSHAKNCGLDTELAPNDSAAYYEIIAHHNMILDSREAAEDRAVELAQDVLARSTSQGRVLIDFDDMLYLPLKHKLEFDKANCVFIDEAQDTNAVQRALLRRMVAKPPHGRLVAVGDPNQAIYGFRGADADAMDLLEKDFQMIRMPLSVSFRCSKAVVREAQKFCI